MTEQRYFIELTHEDQIRVRFDWNRGAIDVFMVQYEAAIGGRWRLIIRYDLAHGYLHRDRPDPRGELTAKEAVLYGALADALTDAIRDIKSNWPEYRRWFEERLR